MVLDYVCSYLFNCLFGDRYCENLDLEENNKKENLISKKYKKGEKYYGEGGEAVVQISVIPPPTSLSSPNGSPQLNSSYIVIDKALRDGEPL